VTNISNNGLSQNEGVQINNNPIVKKCNKHGNLTRSQCVKGGFYNSGKPIYNCKNCRKESDLKRKEKSNLYLKEWRKQKKLENPNFRYYKGNTREKINAYGQKRRNNLAECYVRTVIKMRFGEMKITKEFLEFYRIYLFIKREIKRRQTNE